LLGSLVAARTRGTTRVIIQKARRANHPAKNTETRIDFIKFSKSVPWTAATSSRRINPAAKQKRTIRLRDIFI
jgi:hypothetical protein